MELTDIHNRRANIELVSQRAKEHNYPYLAWPEDKELLRLADLPQTTSINRPADWTDVEYSRFSIIFTDQELREFIRPGFGYSIAMDSRGKTGKVHVEEWTVTTR